MRVSWIRLAWKEIATVSVFLPVFFFPRIAGFASFPWNTVDSYVSHSTASHQGSLEPDPEALRKVIVVPGVRMWGEALINAHRELEENFGPLIEELQKRVLLHEGIPLAYPESTEGHRWTA